MPDIIVADDEYNNLAGQIDNFKNELLNQIMGFEQQLEDLTANGVTEGDTAKNLKLFFDQVGIVGQRSEACISDTRAEVEAFVSDVDTADRYLYGGLDAADVYPYVG